MLLHASFAVEDPATVARTLAKMLGASVVRAPLPPFPEGSWFVCFGDDAGSYLEVLPRGHVFDPDDRRGLRVEPDPPRLSAAHLLVAAPVSAREIVNMAEGAGWPTQIADTQLFRVVKVWVENTVLLELLPPEFAAAYRATFDAQGVAALNGRLRQLEALQGALSG